MKLKQLVHAMAISLLFSPRLILAYEIETHAKISEAAAQASSLSDNSQSGVLKSLGLNYPIDDKTHNQEFPNSKGTPENIQSLIEDGARFEDDFARSINHFFDPLNNVPLSAAPLTTYMSPDWALEDQGDESGQANSYKDARGYFYDALTNANGTYQDRNVSWGKLFQSLGQIVHHVQDMAQPQHVRNDAHCDLWGCLVPGYPFDLYHPSRYEKYTDVQQAKGALDGLYTLYPPVNTAGVDTQFLTTPRQFWHTESQNPVVGRGLAEFTNVNFVSARTNFDTNKYPSPSLSNSVAKTENANDLLTSVGVPVPSQCLSPNPPCEMMFIETPVTDNYRPGQSGVNPRTSTWSIFDQDLKAKSQNPVFALNRFNFDAAQQFLIPRAVAYSAGLINYFFRGRMQITLPDEGVYAVVDHGVEKDGWIDPGDTGYGGFTTIKLKIQNSTTTLDSNGQTVVETMQGGQLWAVARFHRNACYQPDLSGEYGAPGQDWTTCRTKGADSEPATAGEDIVVSNPVGVPVGVNDGPQPVTFTFPNKIPINASDLYLQVVYRGPLGQESDAVAVVTRDIAEPTFIGVYADAEQWLYNLNNEQHCTDPNDPSTCLPYVDYSFKQFYCDFPVPAIDYDTCKVQYRLSFLLRFTPPQNYDPADAAASFQPVIVMPDIKVSRYARIAVLADPVALAVNWIWTTSDGRASNTVSVYPTQPVVGQWDVASGFFNMTTTYQLARGLYAGPVDYAALTGGDAFTVPTTDVRYPPDINPLDPMPSTINFPPNPP